MRKQFFVLGCLIIFMLSGCIPPSAIAPVSPAKKEPTELPAQMKESNLVTISYKITDHLLENLSTELNKEQIILVASFVDVKHLERSSNFGRVMAECITSRLAQKGYMVVEIKLRDALYIKEQAGEFLLSRRVRAISDTHNAQAVVVGTYARAKEDLYISARFVQASDARIISTWDFKLPLSDNLKAMFYSPINDGDQFSLKKN